MSAMHRLLVRLRMAAVGRRHWRPFLRQTSDPTAVQREVLASILRRNRDTTFGREHGFAAIASPADFAAAVAICDYEQLRPYLERQEAQRTPELVAAQPILYARTSGTTGRPKHVPVLPDTLERHRRDQGIFACCHYAAVPGIFDGHTLAFVSPAVEGSMANGTPYGSMSGLVYQSMPWLLRRNYVVPAAVFEAGDHAWKYRTIAAFALAERDISFIAGANPSTFLKVAEVIRTEAETLVRAVESGRLPAPPAEWARLHQIAQRRFRASRQRADELRTVFASAPAAMFSALWPGLKAVSCWREGGCRALLPALDRLLDPGVTGLELGYLSSECRGSLPVDSRRRQEVPTLHENYFEFVECDRWEAGSRHTLPLAALEVGRAYYVIVTTPDGLYRYFMNDIVTVDGRFRGTPTIKFLEKGAGMTSLTGEKLHESQVCAALESLQRTDGWTSAFFLFVADEARQGYLCYLEATVAADPDFAARLDAALAAGNIEYAAKRDSGRLQPVEVRLLRPGAGAAWQAHLVAAGQREAQFKFLRLTTRARLSFDFEPYRI